MFAKINKGRVTGLVESIRTEGEYLPALVTHLYDEEYPEFFYEKKSEIPVFGIRDKHVDVYYHYEVKSFDNIRDEIIKLQKVARQKMQLGSLSIEGIDIYLKDREDSLIISALSEQPTNFKVGSGQWVSLTTEEVIALKQAHNSHVKSAYNWEMENNKVVMDMSTTEELLNYYNDNKGVLA